MKTKRIRRSLLWGVLLAGVAGTLTATTRPVRAETVTSSSAVAATNDESGSSTVKPYAWVVLAAVPASDNGLLQQAQQTAFLNGLGILGGPVNFPQLSSRALD